VPTTLTYPFPINLKESIVTATVIPIIKTYPDGRRITTTSTFFHYDSTSNVTFTPPKTSLITWNTLGTILTYPTVYVAYPTPELILNTPKSTSGQLTATPVCVEETTKIPLPEASTTKFIFPSTDQSQPTPGADIIFALLDELPILTSLLHGDPRKCHHGAPIPSFLTTPVIGFEPVVHTTVSVLTTIGAAVTLAANPFDEGGGNPPQGGGGEQNTGPGNGGTGNGNPGTSPTGLGQPQNEGGSPTPTAAPGSPDTPVPRPGSPVTFNGVTITPAGSGGIVVNGQTISADNVGTVAGGVPVSVAPGGVVVVGSSSVTLPSGTSRTTGGSSTSSGVGAAIASGIGLTRNNAFEGGKSTIIAFEAAVLALVLGGVSML